MPALRSDVTLHPIGVAHAQAMYRWVCDTLVSSNIGLLSEPSLEKTLAWIDQASHNSQVFARAILLSGQHVGIVVVDRVDQHLQTGRFSVYIGESAARGQGAGLTGSYLGLHAAFRQLGLHKICLTVHSQNIPAINTYLKLGFRLEGILRDEFVLKGARVNLLYMGLLSDEFQQLVVEQS
jgi:RimJ/RimL family protein N-acetyltransferase